MRVFLLLLTLICATQTAWAADQCAAASLPSSISKQADWDKWYDAKYGKSVPQLVNDANIFAWHLFYWIRAYVSMAVTYGDRKYMERAVATIDHLLSHQSPQGGWAKQAWQLETGQVSHAILDFVYVVYKDERFAAYRPKAKKYLAEVEKILHLFDAQWIEDSPLCGGSAFYRYANCLGGKQLCGTSALVMYNQGATMAKAWLLAERAHQAAGEKTDPAALHKADAAAAYFLKFATRENGTFQWSYGGCRKTYGVEDTAHGHLDLSLLLWARKSGLGGLTDEDMKLLAGTLTQKILAGEAGAGDVSQHVDGSGKPKSDWDRYSVGYAWIDLADYDPAILPKVIAIYDKYAAKPDNARAFLGWAEILRRKSCVDLY